MRRSLVPIAIFSLAELVLVSGVGHWLATLLTFLHVYLAVLAALLHGWAGYYAYRHGAPGWFCGAMASGLNAAAWATFGGFGHHPAPQEGLIMAKLIGVSVAFAFGAIEGFVGGRIARSHYPTAFDPVPNQRL